MFSDRLTVDQKLSASCQETGNLGSGSLGAREGKGKGTGAFSERVAALSGGLSSEQLNPRNARVAYWCGSWVALLAQVSPGVSGVSHRPRQTSRPDGV